MYSDADRAAIADAITAAEATTTGEIVAIVFGQGRSLSRDRPDLCRAARLRAAARGGAGRLRPRPDRGPGRLVERRCRRGPAPRGRGLCRHPGRVFFLAAQFVRTPLGAVLTPRAIRREHVHAAALTQFRARGIGATRGHTGILIYVSLPDRIAEVVADTGIYARVAPDHWATTVTALTSHHGGQPGTGFVRRSARRAQSSPNIFRPPRTTPTNCPTA